MTKFKTLVYLDAETTGLPPSRPKIAEIAAVAIAVSEPRVLNKIRLGFDPEKPFHPGASRINGLSNDMLSDQKPFEDYTANLLNLFLRHLNGPVCLIAYNGNKFDFPILKSEFRSAGKNLLESIYCVDPLPRIREMGKTGILLPSYRNGKKMRMEPPRSYKQEDIHMALLGYAPPGAHSAEADCMALMRITAALGPEFTDWMDANAKSMETVAPMW